MVSEGGFQMMGERENRVTYFVAVEYYQRTTENLSAVITYNQTTGKNTYK